MLRLAVLLVGVADAQIADPLEIIPPGVAGGIVAKARDSTPWTVNLMPPSESAAETAGLIDSFMAIEKGAEKSLEESALAGKQRLLNAEIAKVHSIVAGARHHSFLAPHADHQFVLHPPTEDKASIDAAVASILKVESGRSSAAAANDAALKQAMLSAEVGKIGRIVSGAFHASFLKGSYVPFDLPKEIFMDTNKGDIPIVNIIADPASFLRAPALAGLEGAIKSMHPAETGAMIKSTLADALSAAAAAESVSSDAVSCARNFGGCPSGWARMGSGCVAPTEYQGPCPKTLDFSGLTAVERATQGAQCGVSFPCA